MDTIKPYPAHVALYEVARTWEHGTIHMHDEIAEIVGTKYPKPAYRTAVTLASKMMLKKKTNRHLVSVRGVGYRVAEPNEHAELGEKEVKKAERRASRGVDILANTDVSKLDNAEFGKARWVADRLVGTLAFLHGERRVLKTAGSGLMIESKRPGT